MAVAKERETIGVKAHQERAASSLHIDTRRFGTRVAEALLDNRVAAGAIGTMGMLTFARPELLEVSAVASAIWARKIFTKKTRLPFKLPSSYKGTDPGNRGPDGKLRPGEGIAFMGNDRETNEELWLTNSDLRTHLLVLGTTGAGKAQPLHCRIKVPVSARHPFGWTTIGKVREGDTVLAPDGRRITVAGVFPQGRLMTWRVRLLDGRSTVCSGEHLWNVRFRKDGRYREGVLTLHDIREAMEKDLVTHVQLPVAHRFQQTWSYVDVIEWEGEEECVCIAVDDEHQLYVTDDWIVTHNTEALTSIVANALCWGSGFLYSDGKGDTSLWSKVYSMASRFGRQDDVLVLSFMKGGSDKAGESNTMNPYALGSAAVLTEMTVGLMGSSGGDDMWKGRAISLMTALMMSLTQLRDRGILDLNVAIIRNLLPLNQIINLYFGRDITIGEVGTAGYASLRNYTLSNKVKAALRGYLDSIPGFSWEKAKQGKDQGSTTMDQHGYLFMQFSKLLGDLADTYDFIFATRYGEIDMEDLVLQRRILCVLLPALEKSEDNIAMLGKIIAAAMKSMMGKTLGAKLEGETRDIIDTKPTNASSPYPVVFDEVGYYLSLGMAVMAAQARSLGFALIFAGQDVSAMKKRGGEIEKEVEAIIANCNYKAVGKLEDPMNSFDIFERAAGEAVVSENAGYEYVEGGVGRSYRSTGNVSLQTRKRITFRDLKAQVEGQFHMFFGDTMVRGAAYYADVKTVKKLKLNSLTTIPDQPVVTVDESKLRLMRLMTDLRRPGTVIQPTVDAKLDRYFKAFVQIVNMSQIRSSQLERTAAGVVAIHKLLDGSRSIDDEDDVPAATRDPELTGASGLAGIEDAGGADAADLELAGGLPLDDLPPYPATVKPAGAGIGNTLDAIGKAPPDGQSASPWAVDDDDDDDFDGVAGGGNKSAQAKVSGLGSIEEDLDALVDLDDEIDSDISPAEDVARAMRIMRREGRGLSAGGAGSGTWVSDEMRESVTEKMALIQEHAGDSAEMARQTAEVCASVIDAAAQPKKAHPALGVAPAGRTAAKQALTGVLQQLRSKNGGAKGGLGMPAAPPAESRSGAGSTDGNADDGLPAE